MFSDRTYVTIDDVKSPAEGELKNKGFCNIFYVSQYNLSASLSFSAAFLLV